jgi:hypothetical protein
MRRVLISSGILIALLAVDAWLIAHPNWLGRLGFWIYKYNNLKTFPHALATLFGVSAIVSGICLAVYGAVRLRWIKPGYGSALLSGLSVLIFLLLVNVMITFSHGNYSHTGTGFRIGVNLFPCLLLFIVFGFMYEVRVFKNKMKADPLLHDKVHDHA